VASLGLFGPANALLGPLLLAVCLMEERLEQGLKLRDTGFRLDQLISHGAD
jgi:hypothetical protein